MNNMAEMDIRDEFERLLEMEQTFYNFLKVSANLIVIINDDARVEYISKGFAKILGFEKQSSVINMLSTELFSNIELAAIIDELMKHKGHMYEIFSTKIDNKLHWFAIHSAPIGESGIARLLECTDITDTVEAQRKAEASDRAKSDFLARMSHEIRTPLNAILGIAQIEINYNDLPTRTTIALEKLYNSGNVLLGIIDDILDMSKIETGKMELNCIEYDTPSSINDTVQINVVRIGSKPINFILDVNEDLPSKLYGDELRIKQILNNLLSNAIKYTDEGYVKLSISHVIEGDDVTLCFTIKDTGQGLKHEDLKKLFTEYSRFNVGANYSIEGTGLGLNITKGLVELMDGTITTESEYGKGSTFTVKIKQTNMSHEPIGVETAKQLRNFTFSGKCEKSKIQRRLMPYGSVLVVDDINANLYIAEGLLSFYQLNIETADSGVEALKKIESGKSYDIIFMDHMMPILDGIETTHKLREIGYRGIIVALTANALVGNEEMFMRNGFNGFISKPIDVQDLDNVLNTYIHDKYKYPEYSRYWESPTQLQTIEHKGNSALIQATQRDVEKGIVALHEALTKDDIKLFTVTVHGLKSALANIDEQKASKIASDLEEAGLNGDVEFIRANAEAFVETLKSLLKTLVSTETDNMDKTEKTKKTDNIVENMAYLEEQLAIIKSACEDYDAKTAYTAFDRLAEMSWKPQTSAFIERLHTLLYSDSDFDKVVEVIENIKATLSLSRGNGSAIHSHCSGGGLGAVSPLNDENLESNSLSSKKATASLPKRNGSVIHSRCSGGGSVPLSK